MLKEPIKEENNFDDRTLIGMKWNMPMCIRCKYNNKNGFCEYFNKDRLEVEVDIFDCPFFEDERESLNKFFKI